MSNSKTNWELYQEMGFEMKGKPVANKSRRDVFTFMRRMRDVRRLAGFHLTRGYSDAEHCLYVGLLFLEHARIEEVPVDVEGMEFVLAHDVLETVTGDLLFPAKNGSAETARAWEIIESEIEDEFPVLRGFSDKSGLEKLGDKGFALFKACDYLELWLFCKEEAARGNILLNTNGSSVEHVMYSLLRKSSFASIRERVGA